MSDLPEVRISLSQETPSSDSSLAETATVLNHNSLRSNANPPAALSNLFHSNVVVSTNHSAQNATAVQGALARINMSALGKAIENVQGPIPLTTRSQLAALTGSEMAQLMASLKALITERRTSPVIIVDPQWKAYLEWLMFLFERLKTEIGVIDALNKRISGEGTPLSPYTVTDGGPIFAAAPITFGFTVPPSQVTIEQLQAMFGVT